MKNILICIILGGAFACGNDENKDETEIPIIIKPSSKFLEFVKEIELDDWMSDTARINKLGLYCPKGIKVHLYNKFPFYNIPYEKSAIGHIMNGNESSEMKTKSILSNVKQIWGYYYRKKNQTNYVYDGMIEQWSFSDRISANLAFKELQKYGDYIFFNTLPYFHKINTDIYIFHTRAMAFSIEQKVVYENFITDNNSTLNSIKK